MAIETNELIDVQTLPPFKKFIMSIGAIPTSYLESMSYAEMLAWFCNYLQNTVIPTVNNNGEAVEELQDLFVTLKNYVDTYFDNLDVQEEINTKLDEMVEDGTLQTLIDTYAQPILSDLTEQVEQLADDVEETISDVETKIEHLRKEEYNYYTLYDTSALNDDFFKKVTVYRSNDKKNIRVAYNLDDFKNESSTTYYVSTTGNDSNDGTSEATAWRSIGKAVYNNTANTTIIIKKGIYYREYLPDPAQVFRVSKNIIAEKGTLFIQGSELTWTQDETYTNVYTASRTAVNNVVDIRGYEQGFFSNLTQVNNIETCNNTLNSYYLANGVVGVNIGEEVTNSKIAVPLALGYEVMKIPAGSNLNVYLENIDFIGGNLGCILAETSNTLTAVNCSFLFSGTNNYSGVKIQGASAIFIGCKACFNYRDGFSYSYATTIPKGIEINCVGSYNGLKLDDTCNGSTTHSGGKMLRINGNYFCNRGGNVADVQNGTISFNFNCNAFDSKAVDLVYSQDFALQQPGATMYLINCFAKGSSYANLYAVGDTTMYLDNTEYNNHTGSGNFIEE